MTTSFEDFYKYLLSLDKDVQIEGEIAGCTVYVLHIHESNAKSIIKVLEDSYGAHVFDISTPKDMLKPSDEELEKLSPPQRKQWEKASHRWVFRCYIPPAGSDKMLITSEITEAFIKVLNKALEYDAAAISRALFVNHPCEHTLVQDHPTITGNVMYDPGKGKPMPTVSAWGVLNGLIQEVTGERLTYKTVNDSMDLDDIVNGKDPVAKFLRKTR